MGLRAALRRAAVARPGVLLVARPGGTAVRLAAEAEVRRRGWPQVSAPAAANLLVVAGDGAGEDGWVEAVWRQVPAPRARVTLPAPSSVAARLDAGAALLTREPVPSAPYAPRDPADPADLHAAERVMADRAADRDGLRLDVLHLPLGPALADWPCGLVLDTALQGDVVQRADVRCLPAPEGTQPYWNEPWLRALRGRAVTRDEAARRRCAAHLDSLGRFLAVSGWPAAAVSARRLRDGVVAGAAPDPGPFVRRVSRSRTLRWLTAGLGPLPSSRAHELGVTGPALVADGDALDRVHVWLDDVVRSAADFGDLRPLSHTEAQGPRGRVDRAQPPSAALLLALEQLLPGTEFAAARLIVASLDPDVDELAPASRAARG
ncbi:hypothetical protein ACH4E8_13165 [Streptomyces sp. NPDC017979]|uniref:hypothetical protein n=1 Tax=Streptomyces sp. NPDC017979 TaxID=3365024 RepID=UPI0037A827F2